MTTTTATAKTTGFSFENPFKSSFGSSSPIHSTYTIFGSTPQSTSPNKSEDITPMKMSKLDTKQKYLDAKEKYIQVQIDHLDAERARKDAQEVLADVQADWKSAEPLDFDAKEEYLQAQIDHIDAEREWYTAQDVLEKALESFKSLDLELDHDDQKDFVNVQESLKSLDTKN